MMAFRDPGRKVVFRTVDPSNLDSVLFRLSDKTALRLCGRTDFYTQAWFSSTAGDRRKRVERRRHVRRIRRVECDSEGLPAPHAPRRDEIE